MSKKFLFKKAIILGGSSGLGKEITKKIKGYCKDTYALSSKNIDTSDLKSVKKFIKIQKSTDVLILNSGGPPPKSFFETTEKDWLKYFNQLFLGYCMILKDLKINNNGYIFLISSSIIKEPSDSLIISSSLRLGFSSVLKSLSKTFSSRGVSIINIAPGPFKTKRVKELVKNLSEFEKKLPTKKIGNPSEIGLFVKYILSNKIKYISGSTIYFDGNTLNSFY
tara:strand:+ start:1699 stop:2364 length:666 start_codon:yes stop_codon:yes gene_type:complete